MCACERNDVGDGFGIERQMRVALERFGSLALIQSAVEQNALMVCFDKVHRAGGRARGAVESDFHLVTVVHSTTI